MKYVVAITLAGFLSACGTTSSVAFDIPKLKEANFTFRDERPVAERSADSESDQTGTTTSYYADDNLSPPASVLLERALSNAGFAELAGKTVRLHSFLVRVSVPFPSVSVEGIQAATQPTVNTSATGAALAGPVIFGIESMRSKKVVTVAIRGSVDQIEFVGDYENQFRGHVSQENIRSTISKALEQAVKNAREAATY